MNNFKIGDNVIDPDGTQGIVTEIRNDWVRYKCRPYCILANLLTNDKNFKREREFWTMARLLK